MTQAEFKHHQATIGCTGSQLARWMGVTPLTVTRWRTGQDIPGPVALAMKALVAGWRP